MGGGISSRKKNPERETAKAPPVTRRIARPQAAEGTFLRFVSVNDVYKLDNYPRVSSAIKEFKIAAVEDNAVVVSVLPGDFLSPCTLTNLDGGVAMLQALNEVPFDMVMFGNHEFDLKAPQLQTRIKEYDGKWINSNVTEPRFVDKNDKPLPEYDIVMVGDKKVAIGAFLLDDMNQFAPRDDLKIAPPRDAVVQTWDNIKAAEGKIDAFLPMLHLNIKEDRAFADAVAKHPEMSKVTPVLLAAHDHEVYIEQAGKSLIFKVGCDAENVGIVDIFWNAEGKIKRAVHMLEVEDFPKDPGVQKFVDKELAMMAEIMEVDICVVPDMGTQLSTNRVRFEMEPMVSFLLSTVKRSAPGVELVFLQGGNVRGMTEKYEPGPFTFGNLMNEFAFDTAIAIVEMTGEVIEASIKSSRTGDGAKPFFLHTDMEAEFGKGGFCEKLDGLPFDPSKKYKVATYQFLLNGMGNIEPMTTYSKDNAICPPLEKCPGIKTFFMKTCMRKVWLKLAGCDADGEIAAIQAQLSRVFDMIDTKKDDQLDEEEVRAYVEASGKADLKVVKFMISAFDSEGTERLTRQEFETISFINNPGVKDDD